MDYTTEVQTKLARVRALMQEQRVGAVWLRRADNVAWITGGVDMAVNIAEITGVASVMITDTQAIMWTNRIEAPRLRAEDDVEGRGFELRVNPWEQPMPIELGSTLGTDIPMAEAKDLSLDLRKLRAKLLEVEVERFQELGTTCALAMHAAIQRTQPGMIEWQIAGALADETRRRAVTPTVVLIATDERVHHVRHPLPTNQTMKRYAMLVLCGRKNGLICSITRLVHYGALADDLRRRMYACAEVDAAMIAASQPGMTLGEMFMLTQDAYARVGFDGEWQLHHQGGIAGYAPRELLATPNEKTALAAGMVCAWNPSISGVKSEDSILVTEHGAPQILTQVPGWPTVPITVAGLTIPRPLIVENP